MTERGIPGGPPTQHSSGLGSPYGRAPDTCDSVDSAEEQDLGCLPLFSFLSSLFRRRRVDGKAGPAAAVAGKVAVTKTRPILVAAPTNPY